MEIAIVKKKDKKIEKYVKKLKDNFKLSKKPDLVFVIGGDGTMFRAEQEYPGIPKIGLSKGRLAFLMEEKCEKIDSCLEKINKGDFRIEEHLALECEEGRVMNDIAVLSAEPGKMIEPIVEIRGEKIPVRGDGLVITTPTGSTAYSLAAGGPVISPEIDAYGIVPLASQKRLPPIIVDASEKVKISGNFLIVIDGQTRKEMKEVNVKASQKTAKIVKLRDNFFKRLFKKLSEGVL